MLEETTIKEILKERARRMSLVDNQDSFNTGSCIEGLLFSLSNEIYAIKSSFISEVVFIKEITPLPNTPDFLLGIINVRGRIISVVDLRKFFGLPVKGIGNLNRVIVVEEDGMEFGILTDEIKGNRSIDIDNLQNEISGITEVPDNYIAGVSNENVIVLDISKIISEDKLIINDRI